MQDRDLVADVEHNYLSTWSMVGEAVAGAEVAEGPPLCVASGAPLPFFNPAFFVAPSSDPAADLESVDGFFSEKGLPYLVIFREGVDPAAVVAAEARSFSRVDEVPGMAMWPVVEAPPRDGSLDIHEVGTPAQHHDFLELMAESFELPLEPLESAFTFELLGLGRYKELLGYEHGRPVAGSAVSFTDGIAGIYNVVTSPAARGRGLGAQMTWTAVAAGRQEGCEVATLQSSSLGFGVYRRMGFTQVSNYLLYVKAG